MTGIQRQLKQKFFNTRAGVILWILSWPVVSMLFDSHPHYPAFLTPIGLLWLLGALLLSLDESDFLLFKEVEGWSFSLFEEVDDLSILFFEEFVLPGAVFWLVLIGVMVFFPSKK